MPEPLGYRIKNRLLGPPLVTEQLDTERLGTFVGMGVLTPDAISSSAYGTEEMLVELVPYVGLAAFALVIPMTFTLLLVLFFVTLSYRQVVMVYTRAGGSYVVARENFGPRWPRSRRSPSSSTTPSPSRYKRPPALMPSCRRSPALLSVHVPISVAVVVLIAYGNLRGIREAGRFFAVPTYFFIFCLLAA